jgi:hypothetical protein
MLCKIVIIKCIIFCVMGKLSHDFEGTVVLQNCMDILKSEPSSSADACVMSSGDGNQVVDVKVEEVTDMNREEDPEPTTPPLIKTEPAVRYMCVSSVMHI